MAINSWITNEYTSVLQKAVRQIVADPATYRGQELLPSVQIPAQKVRVEVIKATGGLMQEHRTGTDIKYIQSFGTYVTEFIPPSYREGIHYDEQKLLYLRDLGNNDTSLRGVRKYINQNVEQLKRRMESRIELQRWQAIFDGGYSWMGNSVSFGVPSQNRATPASALWSLDGVNANNLANPVADMRYWLMKGYAPFRKYQFKKIWMNSNTARWILENTNTKSYLTSYGANPSIIGYDLNKVLSFLIPGLPAVEIYDGWYQTESLDGAGDIAVSDAILMVPDGQLFFEVALPDGDKIGEFQETVHLAGGSIDNPGYGRFLVIEDNTQPGTKGGPSNPFVDLIAGVNGGVKLDRPFDVLTAKVVA